MGRYCEKNGHEPIDHYLAHTGSDKRTVLFD